MSTIKLLCIIVTLAAMLAGCAGSQQDLAPYRDAAPSQGAASCH